MFFLNTQFASLLLLFFSLSLSWSLESLAASNDWADEYKRALRLPQAEACAVFTQLAKIESASARMMAVAKRISSCQEKDLNQLKGILSNQSLSWLHPTVSQQAFHLAKEEKNQQAVLELVDSFLNYNEFQQQKEEALLTAIAAAEATNNSTLKDKLQKRLWKLAPRTQPNPPASQWSAVAEDYKLHRQWQKAADIFLKVYQSSSSWSDKLDALDGVRKSLKEKYRDPSAGGTVEDFLASSAAYGKYALDRYTSHRPNDLESQRKLTLAWLQYGRDIWSYAATIEEQKDGIRNVIKKFLEIENHEPFIKASVQLLASRVSQNHQEFERGINEAEQGLHVLNAIRTRQQWASWQRELYDDLLWKNAFLTRKQGDLTTSLEKMKVVAQRSFHDWARRRGQFWLGRTYKQLGQNNESLKQYQQVITQSPFHYYALWARFDAGITADPIQPIDNSHPQIPAEVSSANHRLIQTLVQSGEAKLARLHMNSLLPATSAKLSHLLYRDFVGDHSTILDTFFFQMNSQQKEDFQRDYTSILFPTPHLALVQESANRWPHLDQHYIYSIMRQESTFNPFSYSWADARGLLQLVPRVAEVEKIKAGVDYQSLDELFLPEVNIPIGSAALDTRFEINFNNFIISTGSYNAGEPRVHGWWKNLFSGDVFEFLEDIPTEETRLYIRIVANNYFTNLRLHSSQPVEVPAHLFALGPMPSQLHRLSATDLRNPVEPDVFSNLSNF